MWSWMDPIARPMGAVLKFIYETLAFQNYGFAIIIFTVFIRLIILPLTIKQYKSTANMQKIQPLLQEIQKKYKNDKEKLNQEMMKLYSEHKVNPAGGCLPVLIQMPIIFSLYWDISRPLYYMFNKSNDVISKLFALVPGDFTKVTGNPDLTVMNYFAANKDKLADVADMLKPEEILNMHFLGLNLGLQPTFDAAKASVLGFQFFGLLLIPILAALTTYLSLRISMKAQSASTAPQNEMAQSMSNSMTKVMPLMTGFFAFSVPAGLGLYWIVGNLIQMAQQVYINKHILKLDSPSTISANEVSSKEVKGIETKANKSNNKKNKK